ncbi:SCRIB protein, partial [Polypterus senegalus]
MRKEREEANRLLEEEAEGYNVGPLKMDYKTLAALPSTSLQKVNRGSSTEPTVNSPNREAPYSPVSQQASINFISSTVPKDNASTKPGVIQPVSRARPSGPHGSQDGQCSPNPFQHSSNPLETQNSPRVPSPLSPDEFPVNIKQAYKTFAAVPTSHVVHDQQDNLIQRNNIESKPSPEDLENNVFEDGNIILSSPSHSIPTEGESNQDVGELAFHKGYVSLSAVPLISRPSVEQEEAPSPSGLNSPEQRSFRDRQKYFEIEVKQQIPENKPKPRVSLVGEDDLKKMREEEARKIEQRAMEMLVDEEEDDEDDLAKQMAAVKAHGKVVIDGVEYKIERVDNRNTNNVGVSQVDGKVDSQRNSLEDSFRLEQRPNSMTGLSPVYGGEPVAPIRTAKAERRYQERLRMQSPELLSTQEKDLSPAEKRALEAEKRAMWRAARPRGLEDDMKQYEQDLAKKLYQSRQRASQSPDISEDVKIIDDSGRRAVTPREKEIDGHIPLPATSALEEMALYSNKRKLRHSRRSLETAVPT